MNKTRRRRPAFAFSAALACGLFTARPMPAPAQTPASAPASVSKVSLSFDQAVGMALSKNLQSLLAQEKVNESKGRARELSSELWPQITATASQQNMTVNLAAEGFESFHFPGVPTVIGPFGVFDARLRLVQTLLDFSRLRDYETGQAQLKLSQLEESLSKPAVSMQAALAYVEAVRSLEAVDAAKADLDLANSLLKLAQDEHAAGTAHGVDVARAQTRSAEQSYRLAQAKLEANRADLALKRIVGLPLKDELILTDGLAYSKEQLPPGDEAVSQALSRRIELQVAREEIHFTELEQKAAEGRLLPSISAQGDYGLSGTNPNKNVFTTRSIGAFVSVPLLSGGALGRVKETGSRKKQAELVFSDLTQEIEEEARLGLEDVAAAGEEVSAADDSLDLAQRELGMAKDRFASGVADNLEVLSAQTSLAQARENHVAALALYNGARVRLALALGVMESFKL